MSTGLCVSHQVLRQRDIATDVMVVDLVDFFGVDCVFDPVVGRLSGNIVTACLPRRRVFGDSEISSQCYKTFFGGKLDFPKIKKFKKVCSDV